MCFACEARAAILSNLNPCLCGAPQTFAAYRRLEADLRRREFIGGAAAVLGMFAGFGLAPRELRAQTPGQPLLLTNLRLFDGVKLSMQERVDILVEGVQPLHAAAQGAEFGDRRRGRAPGALRAARAL